MGRGSAIGLAWALLLVSSSPAVAPIRAELRGAAPCDGLAPLEITLRCRPVARSGIEASLLAPDPFAANRPDPSTIVLPWLGIDPLVPAAAAAVPEPTPLLGLGLGLAGFAALRSARRVRYSGRS